MHAPKYVYLLHAFTNMQYVLWLVIKICTKSSLLNTSSMYVRSYIPLIGIGLAKNNKSHNFQGPLWHGCSDVHTHMTNTRITDPEILEKRYFDMAGYFFCNRC